MPERLLSEHPRVASFLAATAFYLTLIAAFAQRDDVVKYFMENTPACIGVLILLELVTAGTIWLLLRKHNPGIPNDPFITDAVEKRALRNATPDDFPAMENLYHEWFPSSLSIDDAEFLKLLDRGDCARVLEVELTSGNKRIVGSYSFWPLAPDIFESLAQGRLKERNLKASQVLSFSDPRAEVLYLPEIYVSTSGDFGPMLLRDAMSRAGEVLERHTNFKTVAAWAYTPIGRSLVRRARMTPVRRFFWWTSSYYQIDRETALAIQRPRGSTPN